MSDRTQNTASTAATVSTRAPLKYRQLVQRLGPILRSNDEFACALSRAVESVDAALVPHPLALHALEQKIGRLEVLILKLLDRTTTGSDGDEVNDEFRLKAATEHEIAPVHGIQNVMQGEIARDKNSLRGSVSAPRQLADVLVQLNVRGDDGEYRVMTRSEIEHILFRIFPISRNSAQSAATKAVNMYDRGNPERLSRRKPITRKVGPELQKEFERLRAQNKTLQQIADETGADRKTIRKHLKSKTT